MFCQPGTKIIQLFTATSDEFIKIGQYLDLDYRFLKCRTANPVSTEHEVIKNLVVDVKKNGRNSGEGRDRVISIISKFRCFFRHLNF